MGGPVELAHRGRGHLCDCASQEVPMRVVLAPVEYGWLNYLQDLESQHGVLRLEGDREVRRAVTSGNLPASATMAVPAAAWVDPSTRRQPRTSPVTSIWQVGRSDVHGRQPWGHPFGHPFPGRMPPRLE